MQAGQLVEGAVEVEHRQGRRVRGLGVDRGHAAPTDADAALTWRPVRMATTTGSASPRNVATGRRAQPPWSTARVATTPRWWRRRRPARSRSNVHILPTLPGVRRGRSRRMAGTTGGSGDDPVDFATMMASSPTAPTSGWGPGPATRGAACTEVRSWRRPCGPAVHGRRGVPVHRCTPTSSAPARTPSPSASRGRPRAQRPVVLHPRVTARQSVGVILEMTASYQTERGGAAGADGGHAERRRADRARRRRVETGVRASTLPGKRGQSTAWMRVADASGTHPLRRRPRLPVDDLPNRRRVAVPGLGPRPPRRGPFFSASLDHAIYFHRPMASDAWQLHTSPATA